MNHVLVVDDAKDIQNIIKATLHNKAQIDIANDLSEANEKIQKNSYDLFILDLNLPDGNGLIFLSKLRSHPSLCDIPVLILSANKTVEDRIAGYKMGADDYLVKPFDHRELFAIVESKLHKSSRKRGSIISFENLQVDVTSGKLFQNDSSRTEIPLPPLEFRILLYLVESNGAILSRQQLLDKLWGFGFEASDRLVDAHISSLRKKLGPSGKCIVTVYGSGYRFQASTSVFR